MIHLLYQLASENITLDNFIARDSHLSFLQWKFPWDLLIRIRHNEWFDRLWVVQEVVLAPKAQVFLGPVTVPLSVFNAAWRVYKSSQDSSASTGMMVQCVLYPLAEVSQVRDRILKEKDRLSLFELRLSLKRRYASVEHDQMYALLGLVDSTNEVRPNYDLTPLELYRAVTRAQISTISLMPLSLTIRDNINQANDRSQIPWPSWVVDWSSLGTSDSIGLYTMWSEVFHYFNTSRKLEALKPQFDGKAMLLQGVFVDELQGFHGGVGNFPWNSPLRNQDPSAPYSSSLESVSDTWEQAWLRTTCLDSAWTPFPEYAKVKSLPEKLPSNRYTPDTTREAHPRAERLEHQHERESGEVADAPIDFREYESDFPYTVGIATIHLDMFMTNKRYLGVMLSSARAKPGNKIFIAAGGNMPLVLEQVPSDPSTSNFGYKSGDLETYRVVGICYLHGFMDGEQNGWLKDRMQPLKII
ncbi:hypothetical protein BDV95DRAFT_601221 [Massariosphaeria phaeospora]|uniref:Heterokaryon incompatibility domain-containing protein n=1 Tax=Massariosphaeria phaeospora TaxID=100035 RepID=A0A7C8IJ95_9PLEO|nr:hypothetical protein BDV95DRAFT_601221 [Massariosphaeria phaeospora]